LKSNLRVGIIGAGIMGCCAALYLARRGVHSVLIDKNESPLCGASRWNEGKIHLGFLYAGDPSLRTAKEVLTPGLLFRSCMESLIGTELAGVTRSNDLFLVHKNSVVDVQQVDRYYRRLATLIRSNPYARKYLTDVSSCEFDVLDKDTLDSLANADLIQGGFAVPERSVSTNWLADQLVRTVESEPRVEFLGSTEVTGARRGRSHGREWFEVKFRIGGLERFDYVINASWEDLTRIDRSIGIHGDYFWSHRYRVSLFVTTHSPVDVPSAVICAGPFGDIKNYDGIRFYVSWYPSGLIHSSEDIDPPNAPVLESHRKAQIVQDVFDNLGRCIPNVRAVQEQASQIDVEGGWVFAKGRGRLSDPNATLHQRDKIGIHQSGNWLSVDTGKYSVAPWLASQVVDRILPGV
jgi:hypothetical protein